MLHILRDGDLRFTAVQCFRSVRSQIICFCAQISAVLCRIHGLGLYVRPTSSVEAGMRGVAGERQPAVAKPPCAC